MASLAELTPAERARLLGKPEGELGIAIGGVMNQTNARLIETVYRRLGPQTGQSVLEIGFGNGHTVPLLMQQADALSYVGIDIAETMIAEANGFNRALIDAGRAAFHLASAEAIPCPDGTFDRACAINVVYFWTDPVRVLTEIRRVLRPGGFSIIAGMDTATAAAAPFYRAEFGLHVREADELIGMHRDAGFALVEAEPFDEMTKLGDGTPFARHYHLVIATR
jgi:ubiquinone/menaquinone biosynthesis C-methylase UbiE